MQESRTKKQLCVREDKCIGCLACKSACPRGLICHEQKGEALVISFAFHCDEKDCSRCASICSENALSFATGSKEGGQEPLRLSFPLVRCPECGAHSMPQRILDRLSSTLASHYGAKPEELSWLKVCPECRRMKAGKPSELPAIRL
jgi:ferredoxin